MTKPLILQDVTEEDLKMLTTYGDDTDYEPDEYWASRNRCQQRLDMLKKYFMTDD